MKIHEMRGAMCPDEMGQCFVIFRLPYVVVLWDAFIESWLEMAFVDMDADLLLSDGSLTHCAIELGFQSREDVRRLDFSGHCQNCIFLSYGSQKMYCLQTGLDAIDNLLPLIESTGGLAVMRQRGIRCDTQFSNFVLPIYPGLKACLKSCIESCG
jgi:hypothetical protein